MRSIYPGYIYKIKNKYISISKNPGVKLPNRKATDINTIRFIKPELKEEANDNYYMNGYKNYGKIQRLQKLSIPFHFVIHPHGRISQPTNIYTYIKNEFFEPNEIGILITRNCKDLKKKEISAILAIKEFFEKENFNYIYSKVEWINQLQCKKKVDEFEKIWDEIIPKNKEYIDINDLKSILKLIYYKK